MLLPVPRFHLQIHLLPAVVRMHFSPLTISRQSINQFTLLYMVITNVDFEMLILTGKHMYIAANTPRMLVCIPNCVVTTIL